MLTSLVDVGDNISSGICFCNSIVLLVVVNLVLSGTIVFSFRHWQRLRALEARRNSLHARFLLSVGIKEKEGSGTVGPPPSRSLLESNLCRAH